MKHGWRIIPKLHGNPQYADYVKRVAEAQLKQVPRKPKPVKPEGMSEEDFIFSLQPKSTQAALIKHKDPDYKRDWDAPIEGWQTNPDLDPKDYATFDDYLAAITNQRDLPLDQVNHIEAIRRRSKNTLGQSEESSVSEESKDRAKHHFLVSPPALLSKEEMDNVTNLTKPVPGVPASLPEIEWKTLSTWEAFKHWITGGKVKRD